MLVEQEKKFNDAESESEPSIKSKVGQERCKTEARSKIFTSLQNSQAYLNFFKGFSTLTKVSQHLPMTSQLNSYTKSLFQGRESILNKIRQSQDGIKGQNNEAVIDQKIHKLVFDYQLINTSTIEETLLRSKRFKKEDFFAKQIIVHKFQPSKHYQIVRLEIQLHWYKTQICILNQLGKNPLNQFSQICGFGSFGVVYFTRILHQQIAIKCIPLQKSKDFLNQNRNGLALNVSHHILSQAIKEYIFLLLFSQLQIGPQVRKIGGFDMVIYEDSIEFATEICSYPRIEEDRLQNLKKSLFQMHMLQIVHRDIKPFNIMYSKTFKKNVFIDFGGTQVLKETIGEKTVSSFIGTTSFCSEEVKLLLSSKTMAVDLYFNDIFGLKKSLSLLCQKLNFPIKGKQILIENWNLELIQAKYLLFTVNYEKFHLCWKMLRKKYPQHFSEIEKKILEFLKQLQPNQHMRRFYRTEIDEGLKELPEFKELQLSLKSESCELLFYINTNYTKKESHLSSKFLFQVLQIQNGNLTNQQKDFVHCLSDRKNIQNRISELLIKLKEQRQNNFTKVGNQNLIKLCLLVAHYSSLIQNTYQTTIQRKINICNQTLEIVEKAENGSIQSLELFFDCSIENLKPIHCFYNFFLKKMLRKLSAKHTPEAMVKAVSTLFLLGFPMDDYENVGEHLLDYMIISQDKILSSVIDRDNLTKIRQKKMQEATRIEKIVLYWECKQLFLFFENIFYNRNIQKQKISLTQKQLQLMNSKKKLLMTSKNDNENQFFKINRQFYDKLVTNSMNFNQKTFEQLSLILNSQELLELEISSKSIRKWKLLMCLILRYFSVTFKIVNLNVAAVKSVEEHLIFNSFHNKAVLPYLIYFYMDEIFKVPTQIHHALNKIDQLIDFKQLSLRYELANRFRIALERKNTKSLQQISTFIKNQFDTRQISRENINFMKKILSIINLFLRRHLRCLSSLTQDLLLILNICHHIFQMGINLAINFLSHESYQDILISVPKLKHQDSSTMINIRDEMLERKMIKDFSTALLEIDQKYQVVSEAIKNNPTTSNSVLESIKLSEKNPIYYPKIAKQYNRSQNVNNKFNLGQKYVSFLKQLHSKRIIFEFQSFWMETLHSNQHLRNAIKQHRVMSSNFASMFLQSVSSKRKLMIALEQVEYLFKQDPVNKSNIANQTLNFPTLEITYNYFIGKLVLTNYEQQWCLKMIQLYHTCVSQDYLLNLLHKKRLIRSIFNAYVYSGKTFQEIKSFFLSLTHSIRRSPDKDFLLIIKISFKSLFWCVCSDCFPKKLQNWDPNQFTEYLFQTLNQEKPNQSPYMSLVYYYSMLNKQLRMEVNKGFVKFIFKSLQYLSHSARKIILSQIYHLAFSLTRSQTNSIFINKKSLKQQKIEKIPKSQMKEKKQRQLIYLYDKFMKNQQDCVDFIEDLIEKRLIKEYYIRGFKYPVFIKELFVKKLKRYHQVKQNYKKVQKLTELTKFNILSNISLC